MTVAAATGVFPRLLAKSTPDPLHPAAGTTLQEHTLETVRAAGAIVEPFGTAVLAGLGLEGEAWRARLHRAAELAAFGHDLGKGNDHFQRMVRGGGRASAIQAHRHELLSLWLIGVHDSVAEWLFAGADDIVRTAVLCAVAGHHLKFEHGTMPYPEDAPAPLTVLGGHVDLAATLAAGAEHLGLGAPPDVPPMNFDAEDSTLEDACRGVLTRLDGVVRRGPPELRRFVGAVKALTITADVLASSVVRSKLGSADAAAWITAALAKTCSPDEVREIALARLGGRTAHRFQELTEASAEAITLVRAGCGSGKTVAAYLWGARRAAGRKLFVCYPTTGTATEGYGDYLLDQEVESVLAHSRAAVDLERLRAPFQEEGEVEEVLETGDEGGVEPALRWAALERTLQVWLPKVVVCTADTVLGLLQNYRGGLFAFPAIAEGAFVFDEIHLYDERMFSALLRFLDEFRGVPVLLMTASLQPHRRGALERLCERRGFILPVIPGPEDLETGRRYILHRGTPEEAVEAALATLGRNDKVLWVCNTVDAAMRYADRLAEAGAHPLVYHSRFRYEDRVERHRDVVDAFSGGGPVLAVTTQVCEVSLDLSADLLVSEVAPAPAMIQRLGRLNRRFDPDDPTQRPALFIEPEGELPYAAADLLVGREWLERLEGRPVSQRELAMVFEALAKPPKDGARVEHAWLDKSPFVPQAPLRESEGSITIIRPEEAKACELRGRPVVKEITRRAIPMPLWRVKDEIRGWQRIGMAFVPPPGRLQYSAARGARWVAAQDARRQTKTEVA